MPSPTDELKSTVSTQLRSTVQSKSHYKKTAQTISVNLA